MRRSTILVPTLLVGLAIGGLAISQFFAATNFGGGSVSNALWNNNSGWAGMMGQSVGPGGASSTNGNGWGSVMGSMMNGFFRQVGTVKPPSAAHDMNASLQNATVDKANNSVTYAGQSVKIVVLGSPMMTGADDRFVIGGLVNPTIHVPKGAQVAVELVNEDIGMPHGFEITQARPPYAYMSMMQGGIYPGSFIAPIPAANKDRYPMTTTTFTATQSGEYNYICQYPGHAAQGMYGQILVG